MREHATIPALVATFSLLCSGARAAEDDSSPATERQRGKYLAHHVAMCVVCHSPKNEQGRIIELRKFRGSPIPVESPYEALPWAFRAPNIAGGAARSKEDLVRLLTIGKDSTGWSPRPPMPPFRLSREDAAAVAEYLQSLD